MVIDHVYLAKGDPDLNVPEPATLALLGLARIRCSRRKR